MMDLTELFGAIWGSVVVMFFMMVGSGVGEEVASFFFGRVKGGIIQIIYLLLFMPVFILGGYTYTILQIPQTSIVSTALFFGLWGFFTVFICRGAVTLLSDFLNLKLTSSSSKKFKPVDGCLVAEYLHSKGFSDEEVKAIISKAVDNPKHVSKIMNGVSVKTYINPQVLCYETTKRGWDVHKVMDFLRYVYNMSPEEAARLWRESSV